MPREALDEGASMHHRRRPRSATGTTDPSVATESGPGGSGPRFGQLLMLLGLTGFAISQPLLAVAGQEPTLFIFAGVQGRGIVLFALLVALVPPLLLWLVIVTIGLVHRRAGDVTFMAVAAFLAGATVVQGVKSAGLERGWLLGAAGFLAAVGFALALARARPVSTWTRYTAPLPALAVLLLIGASPVGDLLRAPSAADAGHAGSGDEPTVVFVMFDELPLATILDEDDRIDGVRFPNLARLGDQATWYRDYTTMAYGTLQAVPSILSGQVPGDGQPLWTAKPDNLFSLLVPTHELTVSEAFTQLCGFSTCGLEGADHDRTGSGMRRLLSQMVDVWRQRVRFGPVDEIDFGQFEEAAVPLDPETDLNEPDRPINDPDQVRARPERITDFIESIHPSATPGLYYLHMVLPHQPWTFYPDGQLHQGITFLGEDHPDDPWVMAQFQQMHIFQARYADRILGEILDRLEAAGLFDDSLIVVTADHGVNFETPPNLRSLQRSTIDDLAYVPLLIKSPGQVEGRIDDSNLMSPDVLPTIAQEVGVDVGWEVDGFPAGSPAIDARGDTKQIFDFGGHVVGRFQGIKEFRSADHRPRASDRHIGPIGPDDDILRGLASFLGLEDELGRALEDMDIRPGASARVRGLARLRDPAPDKALPSRITAAVDDPTAGDLVLVAINGYVVTAAPVRPDGNLSTVLPPGALDPGGGNDIALVQLGDDGPQLLDLRT